MDPSEFLIDHVRPVAVVRPASVAELGDAVRRAAADGHAVYPVAGGTMLDLGSPPARPGIAVDLCGLDEVIDFPARDMTVTVRAGLKVARLNDLVGRENLRLPIDVPLPDRATLGGAVAANASGPRRLGYGTLRDYVIGVGFVTDEGVEAKAGGRVVKNVAGYDLCKLMTGSLGTLGVISHLTFKLRPKAEARRWQTLAFPADFIEHVLEKQLPRSQVQPVAVEVLNRPAADAVGGPLRLHADGWGLAVCFEGNREAVEWQCNQMLRESPDEVEKSLHGCPDPEADALDAALRDFALLPAMVLSFKANLRPSATWPFCRLADAQTPRPLLRAHAGSGIVTGHVAGDLTLDSAARMLSVLRDAAVAADGNLIVTRCPPAWKRELPIWGAPRGDRALIRAVKRQLDPHDLFNPGRFL